MLLQTGGKTNIYCFNIFARRLFCVCVCVCDSNPLKTCILSTLTIYELFHAHHIIYKIHTFKAIANSHKKKREYWLVFALMSTIINNNVQIIANNNVTVSDIFTTYIARFVISVIVLHQ